MPISFTEIITFIIRDTTYCNANIEKRDYKLFYGNEELDPNKYKTYKENIISSNTVYVPPIMIVTNTYNINNANIIFELSDEATQIFQIEAAKKMFTKDFYNTIKKTPQFQMFGINCEYDEFICNNKLIIQLMGCLSTIEKNK